MATVYAIANQKGGVGKTTTAVNLAACVAEAGYDTLLVDIDPQCNATLGLGITKDAPATVYDVLTGSAALADVLVPTAIEHLWVAPAGPDLAGATVELPRVAGSEGRLRDALEPIRERYAFTLLDCPPSLGPLTVNALVAADRVIVPVQAEYFALEGLAGLLDTLVARAARAESAAHRRRDAADDARRADPSRAGRRARGPRALSRTGVRYGHPAERPDRRVAELRQAGDPSRSSLRRRGCVLRACKGGSRTWLSDRRGWDADSRRSCPSPRRTRPRSCASSRST